tara:strand:- start:304 stop:594 length:291 start_codon:yes stop_codon:yes gene_type:complete
MIFVKFKIQYGDYEYFDYSWFKAYDLAEYKNDEFITDKDMIREVYAEGIEEEIFENYFDEDTNIYEEDNGDFISVYKVQEMTQKEADVLVKMGVLY